MTINQARVLKGTPKTGGRWAVAQRSENASLTGTVEPALVTGRDGQLIDADVLDLPGDRLLAVSRKAVDYFAARKAAGRAERVTFSEQDAEDMAQDAVVATLWAQATGAKHASAGQVRFNALNRVVLGVHGDMNPVNAKAHQILADQVDARVQVLGRMLSASEVDEMAAEIRARWPDRRHLPNDGFQHGVRDRETNTARVPEAEMANRRSVDANSKVALALGLAEAKGAKTEAKLDVWNAIAGPYGAPAPTRAHSARQATAMRATVAAAGGVLAVARTWDNGEESDATGALFGPFGHLGDADKDAVVNMLVSRSAYAEELWSSVTSGLPRERGPVKKV